MMRVCSALGVSALVNLRCTTPKPLISPWGQTRSFADVRAMSALPPEAVVERTSMDGREVPAADITLLRRGAFF